MLQPGEDSEEVLEEEEEEAPLSSANIFNDNAEQERDTSDRFLFI
jgi:hypothetical protein